MPHSESSHEETNKMAPQVNGDAPSSAFLHHLISYPVISDSIQTFTSNPYGAKATSLSTTTYNKISAPLAPYLHTPYTYISPYISRADSTLDSTLSTIDSKFPYVKKPTGELIDGGKAVIFFPLKKGNEGKEYVFGVFGSEKKKVGGEGVVGWVKAGVATGLVVSSDVFGWVGSWLGKKKEEVKEKSASS